MEHHLGSVLQFHQNLNATRRISYFCYSKLGFERREWGDFDEGHEEFYSGKDGGITVIAVGEMCSPALRASSLRSRRPILVPRGIFP